MLVVVVMVVVMVVVVVLGGYWWWRSGVVSVGDSLCRGAVLIFVIVL